MLYLVALILPPLAVLLCGKPLQALLNCFLTLMFWLPGVVHALLVVKTHLDDKRANRLIEALKQARPAT